MLLPRRPDVEYRRELGGCPRFRPPPTSDPTDRRMTDSARDNKAYRGLSAALIPAARSRPRARGLRSAVPDRGTRPGSISETFVCVSRLKNGQRRAASLWILCARCLRSDWANFAVALSGVPDSTVLITVGSLKCTAPKHGWTRWPVFVMKVEHVFERRRLFG